MKPTKDIAMEIIERIARETYDCGQEISSLDEPILIKILTAALDIERSRVDGLVEALESAIKAYHFVLGYEKEVGTGLDWRVSQHEMYNRRIEKATDLVKRVRGEG